MKNRLLPFPLLKHKPGPRGWLNFLWLFLFFLFAIGFIQFVRGGGLSSQSFEDYRSFYASAQIAWTKGFAQVYDLQLQGQVQTALLRQYSFGTLHAHPDTVPTPYLPVFILIFLPLLALGYAPGYVVWMVFNVLLLAFYLYRLSRAVGMNKDRFLLLQLAVCLPVLSNLVLGQVNILMMVCLGEFLLASLKGNDLRGGLWLGGLLLKPQTLILILPGLLIQKKYRPLAGFLACSAGLLGISLLLGGARSLLDLGLLIVKYTSGLPSNAPEAMMNWRAFAIHLSGLLPPWLAWGLTALGMLATLVLTLRLWCLPVESTSPRYALLLLATFAGTFALTWHAHNHMELLLIPLILYLFARGMLPWKMLSVWLFLPPLVLMLLVLTLPSQAYNLFGMATLAVNLILVVWAGRVLSSTNKVNE